VDLDEIKLDYKRSSSVILGCKKVQNFNQILTD